MGKPPLPRNLAPDRGASDYDEAEATSLDPFALHESELVVVPASGSTEGIREDLKADPDVQDALRWLDPPSNAGAPVATVAMPDPVTGSYQLYTPVPQPYPGAGPYPTPIPNFVPNTGQYYLVAPMPPPPPMPAPAPRSPLLWILVTALVTGGGIGVGWWAFGRYGSTQAAQPAPQSVSTPPAPAVAPSPSPSPPAPAMPAPAEAGSITAKVSSIALANAVPLEAPVGGTIGKLFLSAPGKVAAGDKLVEIRSDSGDSSEAKKLAARVAELEGLAKNDPVYEEFLADARKAERAARGTSKVKKVRAPRDGHARLDVEQGDQVARGQAIGQISSGGDWIVKATAEAEVLRAWSCKVSLGDGSEAPCRIDTVVASAAGSEVTATVSPKDAPWLEGAADRATLLLAPP